MASQVVLLAVLLMPPAAPASDTRQRAEEQLFAAEARKLTAKTKEVRLAALQWMRKYCARPGARDAMPALERIIRHDPDAAVRAAAVEALGMIAYQRPPRVCPLAVVEALLDDDADVRDKALCYSGMYREFAPGTRAVAVKGAAHDAPGTRGHSLWLLSKIAPKDEEVRRILRAARKDPDFNVRCDVHSALFRVTGKLEDVVPYYLRLSARLRAEPAPRTEAEKKLRAQKNYRSLGGFLFLLEDLGKNRADELAPFLLDALKDKDAVLRQGAAGFVGNAAGIWTLPPQPGVWIPPAKLNERSLESLLPYLTPSRPGDDAGAKQPQKPPKKEPPPRLLVRLRQAGVEARLQQMRDADPDPAVRAAAAQAVRALDAARKKWP